MPFIEQVGQQNLLDTHSKGVSDIKGQIKQATGAVVPDPAPPPPPPNCIAEVIDLVMSNTAPTVTAHLTLAVENFVIEYQLERKLDLELSYNAVGVPVPYTPPAGSYYLIDPSPDPGAALYRVRITFDGCDSVVTTAVAYP